jgi:hypothetical protein
MPMQISGVTIQGGMNILPAGGSPSPSPTPGPSDPDFSNVVFMFDGDGTNGGANNTFTDSSTNGFTVTESGDVLQGSFSPYGDNWSNYFPGASQLSIPNDSDFSFGTGDFTWEAWIRTKATIQYSSIIGTYDNTNANAWGLHTNSSGKFLAFLTATTIITGTTTVNDGLWHHVACTRSGSTVRIFVDGVLDGTTTSSASVQANNEVRVGSLNSSQPRYFIGHISNLRVIKGTALYTSNFTPETTPLQDITNTKLLITNSNGFEDKQSR